MGKKCFQIHFYSLRVFYSDHDKHLKIRFISNIFLFKSCHIEILTYDDA